MTAERSLVRRTRRAIYGPPLSALAGLALVVIGAVGLGTELGDDKATSAPTSSPRNPTTAVTSRPVPPGTRIGRFALVDLAGLIYPSVDLQHPKRAGHATIGQPIVGAARAATGGLWLVDRDGRVFASGAKDLGSAPVGDGAPVVGIAPAAQGRGYRIVTGDGHVSAFGARARGDATTRRGTANVIGIAASRNDGYWIATDDGRVFAFGTQHRGDAQPALGTTIIAIASSEDGRGYWLLGSDGRVYAEGAPYNGDLRARRLPIPVVGIAAAPNNGYWIATADGTIHPFGVPFDLKAALATTKSKIVAIVAR